MSTIRFSRQCARAVGRRAAHLPSSTAAPSEGTRIPPVQLPDACRLALAYTVPAATSASPPRAGNTTGRQSILWTTLLQLPRAIPEDTIMPPPMLDYTHLATCRKTLTHSSPHPDVTRLSTGMLCALAGIAHQRFLASTASENVDTRIWSTCRANVCDIDANVLEPMLHDESRRRQLVAQLPPNAADWYVLMREQWRLYTRVHLWHVWHICREPRTYEQGMDTAPCDFIHDLVRARHSLTQEATWQRAQPVAHPATHAYNHAYLMCMIAVTTQLFTLYPRFNLSHQNTVTAFLDTVVDRAAIRPLQLSPEPLPADVGAALAHLTQCHQRVNAANKYDAMDTQRSVCTSKVYAAVGGGLCISWSVAFFALLYFGGEAYVRTVECKWQRMDLDGQMQLTAESERALKRTVTAHPWQVPSTTDNADVWASHHVQQLMTELNAWTSLLKTHPTVLFCRPITTHKRPFSAM